MDSRELAGPPAGWDADEATERVRIETHAYPEHAIWLAETEDGKKINHCARCEA